MIRTEFKHSDKLIVERKIIALVQTKDELILDKKELEADMSEINNSIRSRNHALPQEEYKALCKKQDEIKRKLVEYQGKINEVKTEIQKKNLMKDEISAEIRKDSPTDVLSAITSLKDYYVNFASDKTRVSSLRAMAAQFAEELESIIKATV